MNKPKVFMCWTLNSGVTFYRMMNFAKNMSKEISIGCSKFRPDFQGVADWEYKILPGGKTDPLVAHDLELLIGQADLIIAQKFHSIGGLCVMDYCREKFPKKPFYSEFDDHVFSLNPSSPAYEEYKPGSDAEKICYDQMKMSNGLIVSTEYLRDELEIVNPNVWVIPNAIDFDIWDKLKEPKKKKGDKVRIGWAGGGSHIDDLEYIEQVVNLMLDKFTNIEFVFLGGVIPSLRNKKRVSGLYKWYPINEYPQMIKDLQIDIAIAPLRDNLFNRAKSNLRWLEYSALKLPTVASDVEPYRKCIEHGKTGFLAVEPEQWVDYLSELICDESFRKKIGKQAYDEVKSKFNVKQTAIFYANCMRKMINEETSITPRAKVAMMSGNML